MAGFAYHRNFAADVENTGASMRHVPSHVTGINPDAREPARDTAHRSGASAGERRASIIDEAAANHDGRWGSRHPDAVDGHNDRPARPYSDEHLAALGRQIEHLKDRISLISQAEPRRLPPGGDTGSAGAALGVGSWYDPEAGHAIDQALAEITARQQALDSDFSESAVDPPEQVPQAAPRYGDAATAENQLRDIGERIRGLQNSWRVEEPPATRAAAPADPAQIIADIEAQLHRLTGRIETGPSPSADQDPHTARGAFDLGFERDDRAGSSASSLEQQIRALTAQVAAFQPSPPVEDATGAWRDEPSTVGAALRQETPPHPIESTERRLGGPAAQIAKRPQPQRTNLPAEALRHDLADSGTASKHAAPQRKVSAIEDQIRALTAEVAALPRSPRLSAVVDTQRRDMVENGDAFQGANPRPAVSSIEEQIRALTAAVANLPQPSRFDAAAATHRQDKTVISSDATTASLRAAAASIGEPIRPVTAPAAPSPQTSRIDRLADSLRRDLADITDVKTSAPPNRAPGQDGRDLGAQIESRTAPHRETAGSENLDDDLADIRKRLVGATRVDDLARLNDAIETLSSPDDPAASNGSADQILRKLEGAIAALNGLAANMSSPDGIAELSRDIHALSEKLDRGTPQATETDIMATLDRRLADMADALSRSRPPDSSAIPPDFDVIIRNLTDRLETIQVPTSDQAALRNIEARIVSLSEKLDASEVRLSRLDGVERGVEHLLSQLKELRTQNERKLQSIQQHLIDSATQALVAPAEAIRRDVATLKEIQASVDRRTQDTFEAVYGTIEQVVDRLAAIEQDLRQPGGRNQKAEAEPSASGPRTASEATAPSLVPEFPFLRDRAAIPPGSPTDPRPVRTQPALPIAPVHHPVDPEPVADTPLEPGSGARRVRVVNSAIDRIAASEAVNGPARSVDGSSETRADFVAVARRAAQSVANEKPALPAGVAETTHSGAGMQWQGDGAAQRRGPRLTSWALGVGVVMLTAGALRFAVDLFNSPPPFAPGLPIALNDVAVQPRAETIPTTAPPVVHAETPRPSEIAAAETPASPAPPPPRSPSALPVETIPRPSPLPGVTGASPSPAGNAIAGVAKPIAPATTGSLLPQLSAPQSVVPRDQGKDPLPATIGSSALVAAANAGDPSAAYEIATRFLEGRNVPQDLARAATWFDRAARGGLAPAEFRLGSMYEKGLGLKKDLQEARRLYLAAADKTNAKAMHNLAVLYAEGIEGNPDYAIAAQWFRKAATFGVVDSQYNLAILYARGVGVERNMTESYKWFALAARGGDKDAEKKRDEVAARLEPQQLELARASTDAFVPEHQPDDATTVKAPVGGWDQIAATTATKPKAPR